MKKYISSERVNLFEPDAYVSFIVKLRGVKDIDSLQNAVVSAYSANGSTMSRIVLETDGAAYYDMLDRSGCRVTVDRREVIDIIRDSEKHPFDLKNGELVRIFIIPDDSDGSACTLLIHSHHLAGDGKSIIILLRDIISCLSGNIPAFKPLAIADGSFLDKYGVRDARVKFYSRYLNRAWRKAPHIFGWDDYYSLHESYWNKHTSSLRIETYKQSEIERYRSNGATVNSIIITKLLYQHPDIRSVGIPVDIRDSKTSALMGNLTSGIHIRYRYLAHMSFDRNLVNVHKAIYRILKSNKEKYFVLRFLSELDPTIIDAALLYAHGCFDGRYAGRVSELFGYTGIRKRQLGVSNLGRVEFNCINSDITVVELIFVPPKVSYVDQVVGVSTLGDVLTLCYHDIIEN